MRGFHSGVLESLRIYRPNRHNVRMMWQVRGQDPLLRQLDKSIKDGRYAHSYLLVGPPQVGKGTLAMNMAQAVNCATPEQAPCGQCNQCRRIASTQHADVLVIGVGRGEDDGPSRKEIGIGDVRDIERQASLKPYEGSHRVFIFDGAERMSEEAANALLKTLEEPPPQVLIILLTSQEGALLPTILSRCRRLELKPLPFSEIAKELVETHSVDREEAEMLARLSLGCPGWAISAAGDPSIMEKRKEELERISGLSVSGLEERFDYASDLGSLFYKDRDEARDILRLWLRWWRDLLLIKEGAEEYIHNVDWSDVLRLRAAELSTAQVVAFIKVLLTTLEALDNNANARLALEVMALSLPGDRTGG